MQTSLPKRPSRYDTEEDLLKEQEKFLRKKEALHTKVERNADSKESTNSPLSFENEDADPPLLTDIIERSITNNPSPPTLRKKHAQSGFPIPPTLSLTNLKRSRNVRKVSFTSNDSELKPATYNPPTLLSSHPCLIENEEHCMVTKSVGLEHELEKLAWTLPIQETEKKAQSTVPRFDFSGNLLSIDVSLPVHKGLHHHGKDPDRAGYSVEELLLLMRSSYPSQRTMSVTLLSHIYYNLYHKSYPRKVLEEVTSTLKQLQAWKHIRSALDDRHDSVIYSAVNCLCSWLLGVSPVDMFPSYEFHLMNQYRFQDTSTVTLMGLANNPNSSSKDDNELISQDPVEGIIATSILYRFRYLINLGHLPPSTYFRIVLLLTYFAQHSDVAANAVVSNQELLNALSKVITCHRPIDNPLTCIVVRFFRFIFQTRMPLLKPWIGRPFYNCIFSLIYIDDFNNVEEPLKTYRKQIMADSLSIIRMGISSNIDLVEQLLEFSHCLVQIFTEANSCISKEENSIILIEILRLWQKYSVITNALNPDHRKRKHATSFIQFSLDIIKTITDQQKPSTVNSLRMFLLSSSLDYVCTATTQQMLPLFKEYLSQSFWRQLLEEITQLSSLQFKKDQGACWKCFNSYLKATHLYSIPIEMPSIVRVLFSLPSKVDPSFYCNFRYFAECAISWLRFSFPEVTAYSNLISFQLMSFLSNGDEDLLNICLNMIFCEESIKALNLGTHWTHLKRIKSAIETSLNDEGTSGISRTVVVEKQNRLPMHQCLFHPFSKYYSYQKQNGYLTEEKILDIKCLLRVIKCFCESASKENLEPSPFKDYGNLIVMLKFLLLNNDKQEELFREDGISDLFQIAMKYMCERAENSTFFTCQEEALHVFSLLFEQYESVSFGNPLLGKCVLMSLNMNYPYQMRQLIWNHDLLPSLNFSLCDIPIPFGLLVYFNPAELELEMLQLYATAIAAQKVCRERTPFLYCVAVHHVASVLWGHALVPHQKILAKMLKSAESSVISDLIHYSQISNEDGYCMYDFYEIKVSDEEASKRANILSGLV